EGVNYTMVNMGGDTYYNDSWTPSGLGLFIYTIYMEDNNNNWNSTTGDVTVQDTTPPEWSNLIESADPLEFGDYEGIQISVTDAAGINQVLLEFEGVNYTMVNIGGDIYYNDSWTPSGLGLFTYTIYMEDNNNNWNSTIGAITVQDTKPPEWSNLLEPDPLEFGDYVGVWINVTDFWGINQVLLEFEGEGFNYTMVNIGANIYFNDSWTPPGLGLFNYTIYMQDNNNNWNSTTGNITVQDTTPPEWSNLVESADPLEFGDYEGIQINIIDLLGINQVLLEFEGVNYTMVNIGGNIYYNDSWTPSGLGLFNYTIYMQDNNNNWNGTTGDITVQDTTPPEWSNLIESADPLANATYIGIWIDVWDFSGINQVLLEFEGINYTMVNIGGNTYYNDSWTPSSLGLFNYIIYMEDNNNLWNSTSGNITVIIPKPSKKPDLGFILLATQVKEDILSFLLSPLGIGIIIGIAAGIIISLVFIKKAISKPVSKRPSAEVKRPIFPTKEKKPVAKESVAKEEILYYVCPVCNQYYKISQKGDYHCKNCYTKLQLYEPVPHEKPSSETIPEPALPEYVYHCPNCNKFFKVEKKGEYNCPNCNILLKEYENYL
ncbi:MAG: hypothetical protein ACFFCM_06930, partial [Promethearchaeota archaeon]